MLLWNRYFSPKEGDGESKKDSKESSSKAEQEDEEDESTDDTEDEEVDDSDDESDDDVDEDEEESEDISKKYFTDPNSLDPKLRGAFKKMQGIFTQKMQQAASVIRKAETIDKLLDDPDFREWAEAKKAGTLGKSSRKSSRDDNDDEDEGDEDTPVTKKDLAKFYEKIEHRQVYKEREKDMERQAKEFKKNNPDWEIYKQPILDILEKHPSLSYQEAYDLASREDVKKESRKESIKAKKGANINKPSRTGAKEGEEKKKLPSLIESYFQAKKDNKIR